MVFDFAAAKEASRQVVHDYLAVSAVYTDDDHPDGVALTVRWHNKLARAGALEGGYGVEVIEGIDRLVFNRPQLAVAVLIEDEDPEPLVLEANGKIFIESWNAKFNLESREPDDGPVNEYWVVSHEARPE